MRRRCFLRENKKKISVNFLHREYYVVRKEILLKRAFISPVKNVFGQGNCLSGKLRAMAFIKPSLLGLEL